MKYLILRDPTLRNSSGSLPKLPIKAFNLKGNKISSGGSGGKTAIFRSKTWSFVFCSSHATSLWLFHICYVLSSFLIKPCSCCMTQSHPSLFPLPLEAHPADTMGWKCLCLFLGSLLDCCGCFSNTFPGAGSLPWDVSVRVGPTCGNTETSQGYLCCSWSHEGCCFSCPS